MEIKILCSCGTKYQFDADPVGDRLPVTVQCPACGLDGTEAANEFIHQSLDAASKAHVGPVLDSAGAQPPALASATPVPPPPPTFSVRGLIERYPRAAVGVTSLLIFPAVVADSWWLMGGVLWLAGEVARRSQWALALLVAFAGAFIWPTGGSLTTEGCFAVLGAVIVLFQFLRRRAAERVALRMAELPAVDVVDRSHAVLPSESAAPTTSAGSRLACAESCSPTGTEDRRGASLDGLPLEPCPVREVDADIPFESDRQGDAVAGIAAARFRLCQHATNWQIGLLVGAHVVTVAVGAASGGARGAARAGEIVLVVVLLAFPLYLLWRLACRLRSLMKARSARFRATSRDGAWKQRIAKILWISLVFSLLVATSSTSTVNGDAPYPRSAAGWVAGACVLGLLACAVVRHRLKARIRAEATKFPPSRLLLLRPFRPGADYERRTEEVLAYVHQRFTLLGACMLLGGPDWLGTDIGLGLSAKRLAGALANTPEEVAARLRAFRTAPQWPWISGEYAFPSNAVLCAGKCWKSAFESMLGQADVVLLDFRSFSATNRGCAFELTEVVCRIPTRRWVLLIDETMDRGFLAETLAHAWAARALNPPASDDSDARITVCTLRATMPIPQFRARLAGRSPATQAPASLAEEPIDLLRLVRTITGIRRFRAHQIQSLLFAGIATARGLTAPSELQG